MTDTPLVYTMTQTAEALGLTFTRGAKAGKPNRRLALDLVATGRLRVVDARLNPVYWVVSRAELERYVSGAPISPVLRAVAS